jgi:hypothetical protein
MIGYYLLAAGLVTLAGSIWHIRRQGRRHAEEAARKRYNAVERAHTLLSRPLPPLEPERSRAIQDRAAAAAFLLSQEARCVPRYEP